MAEARTGGRVVNAAGREVPQVVNGRPRPAYQGVGKHRPSGRRHGPPVRSCVDYPENGDKRTKSLRDALERAGLRDGMTISTHHHFRNGDLVANQVFELAAEMGRKDLIWAPSASFPCHAPMIRHLESGVIRHIEGSMNGPLGDFTSEGRMRGAGILRSHGGRWQAIQDGDLPIDIAVIAAPTADAFGNATGDRGPSACGLLGFALADSQYADHVIVVTDNLVPFPCLPWQIQGNHVDQVVVVDRVGDPSKIVSGTTQITNSPDRLLIAEYVARFVRDSGILRNGFSFQAGAGGIALAFAIYLQQMMRERNVKASFVRGGSTRYLVGMLEEGLTAAILDGQTFDLDGVRSMRENAGHVNTSPFTSYNFHGKGNFASMVDVTVLGATEVDVDFNANVVTHSDGRLLHGIGGWQNCLFAKCTVLALPSVRDRIPVLVDRVTTLTGPGELIDVIVTERGIAINPKRQDLREALRGSDLPIRELREIKADVERLCGGKPEPPRLADDFVATIQWVDGTVIDAVRRVLPPGEVTELVRFLGGAEAFAWRERLRPGPDGAAPDPVRVAAALRAHFPADRARALAEQVVLEPRAAAKFADPSRLLFERVALEQATSPGCAAWHAASVPRGARVLDAGCGLGADSLAIASAGHRVVALERDAVRAALARHNLAAAAPAGRAVVVRADAAAPPASADVLFADPDRRASGRRTFDLDRASPSWAEIDAVRHRFARVRVKAPPAIPDEAVPAGAAVEFLSEGGECKEAFLRLGEGEVAGRRAAVLVAMGLVRDVEPAGPRTADCARFMLDPDPALRRAGGVDALAAELDAGRAAAESTYLFADTRPDSPWVRAYPVRAMFPYRPRDLARRLAEDPPREIVVKQRGTGLRETDVRRGLPRSETGGTCVIVLFARGRTRMACLCGAPDPR